MDKHAPHLAGNVTKQGCSGCALVIYLVGVAVNEAEVNAREVLARMSDVSPPVAHARPCTTLLDNQSA